MKEINLLPKNRQQELRYEALLSKVYFIIGLSGIVFVAVFFLQFGVRLYLERELSSIVIANEQIKKQNNKKDNAALKVKIQQINDQISDYKNLVDASPKWSKVIKAFAMLPPNGIRILNFSVDESSRMISVAGFSPSRELVLEFYDRINADKKNFYGLEKYLENIAKPVDINFHFTIFANADLLK